LVRGSASFYPIIVVTTLKAVIITKRANKHTWDKQKGSFDYARILPKNPKHPYSSPLGMTD